MRWEQAQGLDGLMAKLTACEKREEDWLVNMPYCFIVVCTPSLQLLPSSSAPSPLFLHLFHLCLFTLVLLQFLYYEPHIAPFFTTPLQPNALFSLNALFLLTSCLHPSQWPSITPGRIIVLGLSSVAPYSALSALFIYGVSPFAASHLPTVQ